MLSLTKKQVKNKEFINDIMKKAILRIEDRLREKESQKSIVERIIKKELDKI